MSATPEEENQGLILHGYRTAVASAAALLVVVDEAPYRRRLAGQAGADARLAERRAAWTGFARAHGIDVVALDLDPGNAQTALAS
jgi:hypothetical protein